MEIENKIVCAANLYIIDDVKHLFLGVRHFCPIMCKSISSLQDVEDLSKAKFIQGFVDSKGKFHNRTEAWKIAETSGQIFRRVGGDTLKGGTLFSENLY
jgi:hypothetical protein